MATITVKNIPPELYTLLKQSAELNRRSINREVIHCLEQALQSRRLDVERVLEKARMLRDASSAYPMTDLEISRAKSEGRE